MKISKIYALGVSQYELDFVDIDTDKDTPLFIDPSFLGVRGDAWSQEASRTLRNFFQTFIRLIQDGYEVEARALFDYLHEPNETCLGLSRGAPRGNAIGDVDGEKLFKSIRESKAVDTGVVEDLEDFRLFIHGIDKDKISDMTTNVIRVHLVRYTQNQCALWNIQLQKNVQSGFYWDSTNRSWRNEYTDMLIVDDKRILLTPKSAVSYAKRYTTRKYYSKFVLEYLQHEHLTSGSVLIQRRKDGALFVTKKSLEDTVAPYSKEFVTTFTQSHKDVFKEFKDWIRDSATPVSNKEIVEDDVRDIVDFLIDKLKNIKPGNEQASIYHRLVAGILELLFYPDVVSPIVEQEIHDGRKRIDISFDNAASSGFFYRLHTTYQTPSQFIFVECKNYSKEVANPELDQLAGRFSFNRGKVGLLICRTIDDMQLMLKRCNDAYVDQRGIILPITDEDLVRMLQLVRDGVQNPYEQFLSARFRTVAMGD